jgi:hypothetical protein
MLTPEQIAAKQAAEEAARAAGKNEQEIQAAGNAAAEAAKPVTPPAGQGGQNNDQGRSKGGILMSNEQLNKRLEQARRAALSPLQQKAKDKGYASVEEMLEAIDAKSFDDDNSDGDSGSGESETQRKERERIEAETRRAQDRNRQNQNRNQNQNREQLAKEARRLERELQAAQQKAEQAEKRARIAARNEQRLRDRQDERETRQKLQRMAVAAGVKNNEADLEFAIDRLTRHVQGMTEEKIKEFDESKWFAEDLKKVHPYLFGEAVIPANSGSGVNQNSSQRALPTQNGVIDAMRMKSEEVANKIRELGLKVP